MLVCWNRCHTCNTSTSVLTGRGRAAFASMDTARCRALTQEVKRNPVLRMLGSSRWPWNHS